MVDDKEVASQYEKMTQREHVLKRPDTYIGSVSTLEESHDVFAPPGRIVNRQIKYTPGLFKIFDEVLVNALDHVMRMSASKGTDSQMVTEVKVSVDKGSGSISVFNDGDGVDVLEHQQYKMYVPQLVFGELLTSTNYKDGEEEKLWGGRNGYGAKLANIWSTEFKIETCDHRRQKLYVQKFTDNMSVVGKPTITKSGVKRGYTHISFVPDYSRMGLKGLSEDMYNLMVRRVYDAAGLTPSSVNVSFNGVRLPVKKFADYVHMFEVGDNVTTISSANGRWEIGLATSLDGNFSHASFVNGISTRKGGSHVNYVSGLISKTMVATAKKGRPLKASYVKDNMMLFLRCVIPDPTFGSQTKEELSTPSSKYSASFGIDSDAIKKLVKRSGIMEKAEELLDFHESKGVKKAAGRKTSKLIINKLDDANNAGGKRSMDCTLILTEGDSAKTMAISGLSVVGRDNYGVFPLRGKLLNIADRSVATALKNEEVANIVKIMGLVPGKENSIQDLRYGRVMIMADQDHDGLHIRGLIMNLFRVLFHNLYATPGFITSMLTPIVKATVGGKSYPFYSVSDFRKWMKSGKRSGVTVKYYKGLGSSSASEAKEYFREMHVVSYIHSPTSDERMDLAFKKSRADDRKEWLMKQGALSDEPGTYTSVEMDYGTFVDSELVQFSMRDVQRSIPHIMDGLKESMRKILFGALKRPKEVEIKVAQLAGYIAEVSMYHHGEASLNQAIIGMAQTFPGSNNIALLEGIGQFGTRIQGGADAASPRYIHTRVSPIARLVFRQEDDVLLDFKLEDGVSVEPIVYYPIIPLALANGVMGIGTGFSTNIPMFDPIDLIRVIRDTLGGSGKVRNLTPWYRGWSGSISLGEKGTFESHGKFSRGNNKGSISIKEIPVYVWTDDYKTFLESLMVAGVVKDFKPRYTDTEILFDVTLAYDMSDDEIMRTFKLKSTRNLGVGNIHLFSIDGQIKWFKSIKEILDKWIAERLLKYEDRRKAVIKTVTDDLKFVSAKADFVEDVISGKIRVMNVSSETITSKLVSLKYPKLDGSYDFLLKLPINQLTKERRDKLIREHADMEALLKKMKKISASDIWKSELLELEEALVASVVP